MVFDWDDFGANHVISDMCQSHDCRDRLMILKEINPNFKCTLFTIPGEMTPELIMWCQRNKDWIELGVHGLLHTSNYECEKMSYEEFDNWMEPLVTATKGVFANLFKAPGWQISDDIYRWLLDHDWMVADQAYNNERRPKELKAYINRDGTFYPTGPSGDGLDVEAWHGHTWDCVGNGIYETFDIVVALVRDAKDFQFVSEVLK